MKKLEIFIESVALDSVIKIIERSSVAGYSVIDDVTGMGLKGKHVSSVFTEVLRYSLVIVVDSNEKIQSLIGTLKEAIKDYSGKMFLSDAEMV